MSDYRLGIDIGTTYTAAAVHTDGLSRMLSLGTDKPEIPSVVAIDDGEVRVGDAAERRAISDPAGIAREFKRRIGDSTPIIVAGEAWFAETLTASVAKRVLEHVQAVEGRPPKSITVTHPADWHGFKINRLVQALGIAGIEQAVLLSEPVAAATHYQALNRIGTGQRIAVFDLGGGTFDAAIVAAGANGLELVGRPSGLEHFGGIDLDYASFAHVLETGNIDLSDLEDTNINRQAVGRLRADCRLAKEHLSADTSTSIPVMLPGLHTEFRINRSEFESLIGDALAKAIDVMKLTIEDAGLSPEELDGILLVGGGSRIPLIAQMLTRTFGVRVLADAHPKHAVALGAAHPAQHQPAKQASDPKATGVYRWSGQGNTDPIESAPIEPEARSASAWEFFEQPKPFWAITADHIDDDEEQFLVTPTTVGVDESILPGETIRTWADRIWPTNPQDRHTKRRQ